MKRKVKSIRKTMWGVYWKLHDKRKQLVARLKGYLDGLPPENTPPHRAGDARRLHGACPLHLRQSHL